MSDVIFLTNVRLSFPHLAEPHAAGNNPTAVKKYSADFIMSADDAGYKQFMAQYASLALDKWGENSSQVMQMVLSDRKLRCFGQGNEKVNKKTFKPYDGYADMAYIGANRDQMPQMIQADGTPVDGNNTMAYQQQARKMYGGCYVNVALKPWLQDNAHGRGIRCDLVAVQFLKDGEAFGEGKTDASPMFGQVAEAPVAAPVAADGTAPFPGQPASPAFLG